MRSLKKSRLSCQGRSKLDISNRSCSASGAIIFETVIYLSKCSIGIDIFVMSVLEAHPYMPLGSLTVGGSVQLRTT